ncbi:Ubiquitin carboxyl-terminal hydrolase [seawater metagenome]|uniref:Ubiquitin carboxyl-terminal hydrolase n=1 Tax=seawater metagenome TaxID=1561972 RepID=A0A5E8CMA2_9ZZZZ
MINLKNYCGLNNIGNTCYMNSALQMVANNEDIINYFTSNNFSSNNLNVFKKFLIEYKSNGNSFSPRELKAIVGRRNKMFGGFMQNDSHEFLIFLFDIIEEDLKKELDHGDILSKDKESNFISKLFDYKMNSILKCKIKSCNNVSKNISSDRFLSLEIPNSDNLTLDDCYRDFKAREKLQNDERWWCDKCKKKRIASKRLEINYWSPYLFIHLKRFNVNMSGRATKNNTFINVPIYWRHNYVLQGLVVHSGGTGGGHYISVGNVDNKWILFDDSSTSQLSEEQVTKLASCAYLLHYKQISDN